ncbi:hypothetical protein N7524_000042 [Penicillium chrysogenum]|nr:hypothetical protein N7524_000042 [Penicillium chrysogenum]
MPSGGEVLLSRTAISKPRTPNRELQTANSKPRTPNRETSNRGHSHPCLILQASRRSNTVVGSAYMDVVYGWRLAHEPHFQAIFGMSQRVAFHSGSPDLQGKRQDRGATNDAVTPQRSRLRIQPMIGLQEDD